MPRKNILLIDDDPDELLFFTKDLEKIGANAVCQWVSNGTKALDILENNPLPDIIFLDINMPKMNGLDCLKKIRQKKEFDKVPIILYSTFIDDTVEKVARILGASDCVTKPIQIQKLKELIG
jgi:CheY-like chemotaxis protein